MAHRFLKSFAFLATAVLATTLSGVIFTADPRESIELLDSCQQTSPSSYSLNWNSAFPNEYTTYYVFDADESLELKPLEHPEVFLASSSALQHLLSSTNQLSIDITFPKRYLRIIAQGETSATEIASLIDLKNLFSPQTDPNDVEVLEKRPYTGTLTEKEWSQIIPHLIPTDNPIKKTLDQIFSKTTPLASLEHLKRAGFDPFIIRQGRGLIVAKHPKVKNFLFKIYLDALPKAEWPLFVNRSIGASLVRECISRNNFTNDLKAPIKWIYKLPERPSTKGQSETTYPKSFILLVEDMHVTDWTETRNHYMTKITRSQMKSLFQTIHECGLSDSHIDNIPFSSDMKIAFIDTEYYRSISVHPEWITKHLSQKNQDFWEKLIKNQLKASKEP